MSIRKLKQIAVALLFLSSSATFAIAHIVPAVVGSDYSADTVVPELAEQVTLSSRPDSIQIPGPPRPQPIIDLAPRPSQRVRQLRIYIEEICTREPLSSGVVSVFALNMAGDTLVAIEPNRRLVPASNIKLLTTGLAIKTLGPDYRFSTTIAYSGQVSEGTLKGDLYIIGGGDPTMGAKITIADPIDAVFSSWTKAIKQAGISRIEGDVIADPRYFSNDTPENLTWCYDDLGTNYGVGPTGLNFFENAQNFLVRPGEQVGAKLHVNVQYPQAPWLELSTLARTSAARSANKLQYIATSLAARGEFVGTFPIDRKSYTYEGANRYAALTCALYFRDYLSSHGIVTKGTYAYVDPNGTIAAARSSSNDIAAKASIVKTSRIAQSNSDLHTITKTYSPKLASIVAETLHESDNFFAESLLMQLGLSLKGSSRFEDCIDAVEEEFESMGLDLGQCQYYDGSGLSRLNYTSAAFFVDFLRAMAGDEIFVKAIPSPGEKGTLEMKFSARDPQWRSRIRMKSGSMNGIRCYSGYILPESGERDDTIVFSILTNNITQKSTTVYRAIDSIIAALVDNSAADN